MTTQYTPILQLALPVTGELNGTWGDVVNDNITSMVEEAIAGLATISTWTANSHTLTTADGVTDEARCAMLVATSTTAASNIICPNRTKLYVLKNSSSYAVTLKTAAGAGVAVAAGDTAFVFCDGTNVNACVTQIINGHITGNLTVDGNTTLGDASGDTVTVNAGTTTFVNANPTLSQGTATRILFLNGSKVIADAAGLTWDGTTMSATRVATSQVNITGQGDLRLEDSTGGEYVALQAPATLSASYTLTMPADDGTNGQALITDGAGNLSWSTAASGDVYGPASATDNAVARFDGTTGKLIQNSGVTIDDSNNVTGVGNFTNTGSVTLSGGTANGVAYLNGSKVLTTGSTLTFDGTKFGVGTASPQGYVSAVRAASGATVATTAQEIVAEHPFNAGMSILTGNTGLGAIFFGSPTLNDAGRITYDHSTNLFTFVSSASQRWFASGSEQMRLTSTGLGIGTSSPSQRLEVAGRIYANIASDTTNWVGVNNSIGNIYVLQDTSTGTTTGVANAKAIWCNGNAPLVFGVNSGVKATLDASGNLGLGVTPSAWFSNGKAVQLGSGASLLGTTTASQMLLGANYFFNGSNNIYIASQAATYYQQLSGAHSWYTAPSGTAGNAISFTQAMTLDANGNLGIGTTNTGNARLNISSGNQNLEFDTSNSVQSLITSYNRNTLAWAELNLRGSNTLFTTNGSERMRIDSSGNVGIGTSSPPVPLTVNKNGVDTTAGWFSISKIQDGSGNKGLDIGYLSGSQTTALVASTSSAASNMSFWTYNGSSWGERMRLDASGNLGLGVAPSASTIPTLQFGSNGFVTSNNSMYMTANAFISGSTFYYVTSGILATQYQQTSGRHVWYTATTGTAGAAISFTEAMRLDASGNLLVGTTTNTNSSKLVVNGTISETVGGTQYLVLSQADIGTAPNEIPVNGMLGKLAFEDVLDTVTNNPYNDTAISDVQPSLLLDFANAKTLDPRITFTRSTTATYYNGVTTAMAEQNLLTYSQSFTNVGWVNVNNTTSSVDNTTVAPDGTMTAGTITLNVSGSNSFRTAYISVLPSTSYVFSFYALRGTATALNYSVYNVTAASDIIAATSYYASTNSSTWSRITVVFTTPAGCTSIACYPERDAASTGTFFIWGAQLEQRSSVSAYTPTTSQPITNYIPVMQTAAAGVPRFDCNPVTGESLGLLIEEQRTNLLTYSEQFDNAAWTKTNATITANTIVAPDGTLTADKFIEDSNTGTHQLQQSLNWSASTAYTFSFFAKAGERSIVRVFDGTWAGGESAQFNLSTGVATALPVSPLPTVSMIPVGNGWYRCICTITTVGSAPSSAGFVRLRLSNGSTTNYTGDGYSGIYIWGAQLEAGSFATSYIATTSSSVTRNADNAIMTGTNFSSWYNQAEGAFYCSNVYYQTANFPEVIGLSGGVGISLNGAWNGSTSITTSNLPILNQLSQIAYSYLGRSSRSLCLNGAAVATSNTAYSQNDITGMQIGAFYGGAFQNVNAPIKKIAYYPKRLSDAELMEMTE